MRTVVVSALMFASLAVAGAAAAQTQDQAQPAAPADATAVSPAIVKKKPDDGLVCHRERVTGSNRSVKVCTTALQRDLDKDAAKRLMDDRAQPVESPAPSTSN